jgi:hypothetical protein
MTSPTYPSPDADAWGVGVELSASGEGGLGNSDQIVAALEAIRQELAGMRADSAAMRQLSEELIEEARQEDEQPPAPVEPGPAPDFYPFAELPAGTTVRDLPSGGKLFILTDGLILRTGCENTIVAVDENGEAIPAVPGAGGVVTISPGRTLQLAPDFLRLTHEAAGIAGLPVGVEPVQSATSRVSVELPGGTKLGVHRDTRLVAIINPSGTINIVGASRIEGIGEPVQARTLVAGLKTFAFAESGHSGVVEMDGTIRLCLASGEDLTITFPVHDSGEYPPPTGGAVCPTCGIAHS